MSGPKGIRPPQRHPFVAASHPKRPVAAVPPARPSWAYAARNVEHVTGSAGSRRRNPLNFFKSEACAAGRPCRFQEIRAYFHPSGRLDPSRQPISFNSARRRWKRLSRIQGTPRRAKRDCPHPRCMTYAQPMGNLWIKSTPRRGLKDIHRITPKLRPCFTGGFEALFSFKTNHLTYFSTKSGPTTTT